MFWAINKITKKRLNSIEITFSENFMHNEEWYADPLEIEYCPKDIDREQVVVKYRKESKEIINNKIKYTNKTRTIIDLYRDNKAFLADKIRKVN